MNLGQIWRFALLIVLSGSCASSRAAAAAADVAAAESAVRISDAAWATVSNTGNVDAWMAFCAADAIVLLPNEPLASGIVAVRQAAIHWMALPNFAVQWHAIKVDMSPSGDLAHVLGVYELEHGDAAGAIVAERGSLVEIWRKQADGSWKCIVDSWAAGSASTAARSSGTSAAPPTPAVATKYGDVPVNYRQAIRQYFQERLKDPESIQYRAITNPEQGFTKGISGTLLMSEARDYGWIVRASINARNSRGRYVGFKTYQFLFRGEKLVGVSAPLPEDEMH